MKEILDEFGGCLLELVAGSVLSVIFFVILIRMLCF